MPGHNRVSQKVKLRFSTLVRLFVVYDTKYGNTKLAAESIAEGLREVGGIEVLIGAVKDVDVGKLAEADVLVLGAPNHMTSPSRTMMKIVGSLTGQTLKAKSVAVFGTYSGRVRTLDRAVRKMERMVEKRFPNMKLVSPSLSVRVYGVTGPLVEGELLKCKEYGRTIANQLFT
jgi:flavorubredoxin